MCCLLVHLHFVDCHHVLLSTLRLPLGLSQPITGSLAYQYWTISVIGVSPIYSVKMLWSTALIDLWNYLDQQMHFKVYKYGQTFCNLPTHLNLFYHIFHAIIINKCNFFLVYRRPCKIQCTFYCHRVVKNIAPLFVYVGPPPLGSK